MPTGRHTACVSVCLCVCVYVWAYNKSNQQAGELVKFESCSRDASEKLMTATAAATATSVAAAK